MPRPTMKTDLPKGHTILSRAAEWNAATVTINAATVTADADGKKILPAGTLLGSTAAPGTMLGGGAKAKPANDATTEGLLLNEVDVTHGDTEAALLYMGTVGLDRLPEAPSAAAKAALPRVTFTQD